MFTIMVIIVIFYNAVNDTGVDAVFNPAHVYVTSNKRTGVRMQQLQFAFNAGSVVLRYRYMYEYLSYLVLVALRSSKSTAP